MRVIDQLLRGIHYPSWAPAKGSSIPGPERDRCSQNCKLSRFQSGRSLACPCHQSLTWGCSVISHQKECVTWFFLKDVLCVSQRRQIPAFPTSLFPLSRCVESCRLQSRGVPAGGPRVRAAQVGALFSPTLALPSAWLCEYQPASWPHGRPDRSPHL